MSGVSSEAFTTDLREKLVYDWNNFAVGRVHSAERDPKTRNVRSLVVALSDEARGRLNAASGEVVIPVQMVFGIRREGVTLDRSVEEIGRMAGAPTPPTLPAA